MKTKEENIQFIKIMKILIRLFRGNNKVFIVVWKKIIFFFFFFKEKNIYLNLKKKKN